MYLKRLRTIRTRCLESSFFSSHDIIGSSLLFVHDRHSAGIWMIDFEKTRPRITHPKKPSDETTRPDGYLVGLDSIIALLSGLILPDIQTK
jgi:1D-myo-inositol-triphosphate 3-kinase